MKTKKYWIITDLHLGHDKIKSFCGRPDGFEDKIIKNIHTVCRPGDVLICLGDVCWGNDEYWHSLLHHRTHKFKTWLTKGNHDKKTYSWYLDHGWDFVSDSINLKIFGKKILFSHKPMPDGSHYDINVHGHLHNTGHHHSYDKNSHILVMCEHHYMPQDLRKIVNK